MQIEKIATERLELIPIASRDMERIYEIASDPRSIEDFQYMPKSVDEVQGWFESAVAGGDPTWTIRFDGTIIGLIEAGIRQSGSTSEPGCFIDVAFQNNGYATEALKPIIDWTFENSNVHRIEVSITASNVGSRRVVEKCGFQLEGILRQNWPFKGQWHDSAQYSLLLKEWEASWAA